MPKRTTQSGRRGGRRRRRLIAGAVLIGLVGLVAAELVARYVFGLGDPPLFVIDPDIEYLNKPSQQCRMLGHRIHYNAWSMRSDDFPAAKTDPTELRVLVIGDSVVNGGVKLDQSEIVTEQLRSMLQDRIGRPVVVGNLSASSWGPPNQLAYVRRFGLFDADVVVVAVSLGDYDDVPRFDRRIGVDPAFPGTKPRLALEELANRVRSRLEAMWRRTMDVEKPVQPGDREAALDALRTLVTLAVDSGAQVILLQHMERAEVLGGPAPDHDVVRALAESAGAEVVNDGPALASALASGRRIYSDHVHLTPAGHRLLAQLLADAIDASGDDDTPAQSGGDG